MDEPMKEWIDKVRQLGKLYNIERTETAEGVFLFDQARASLRDILSDMGIDSSSPEFIATWALASFLTGQMLEQLGISDETIDRFRDHFMGIGVMAEKD